jgi:predicted RNA-binding Zn ribbon-like protein
MERRPPEDVSELALLGGEVCLDLVNTLDPRDAPVPRDLLRDDDAASRWLRHVHLVSDAELASLGGGVRRELIATRELLHAIFAAVARGQEPPPAAMARFERGYRRSLAACELELDGDAFTWRPAPSAAPRARAIAAVYLSAAGLLMSHDCARVRQCAAEGECGWLFVDRTRSGTRRWCRMEGCGNRAKARRHYAHRRSARGGDRRPSSKRESGRTPPPAT